MTIGRTHVALVSAGGSETVAVLTALSARVERDPDRQQSENTAGRPKLLVNGPVRLTRPVRRHLQQVALPMVNRIANGLGVHGIHRIELGFANPGAASVHDLPTEVSGYSADVPAWLVMLSATLRLPLPEDVLCTGHIASSDGTITAVRSLPAKLEAAVAGGQVRKFIYPALDDDRSLDVLSPAERDAAEAALAHWAREIKLVPVRDVHELVCAVFDDWGLATAALRCGYFGRRANGLTQDAVDRVAAHLLEDAEQRFWHAVEAALFTPDQNERNAALRLLRLYAIHHRRWRRYPTGFGERLTELLRSLPRVHRRLHVRFPLLTMHQLMRLGQFAHGRSAERDLQALLDAASGRLFQRETDAADKSTPTPPPATDEAVDHLLNAMRADAMADRFGRRLDAARSSYRFSGVTVETYDAFLDSVQAFYLHMVRRSRVAPAGMGTEGLEAEAIHQLEEAFADRGGVRAAWAEARRGAHGGMRLILDRLTDHIKEQLRLRYARHTLAQAIDPLQPQEKLALIESLLKRLRPHLPEDLRDEPAEAFVAGYERIAHAYVQASDQLTATFRAI
ncbi:MAG: hypothetical protein WD534_15110 [Phycisphaeraceae bacterium]